MPRHDKRVRDKIIRIIEEKGERATYHTAMPGEFHVKLGEKLREEVEEFLVAENKEELADVFEVITAWLKLKNWDLEEIVRIQEEKREQRGAFEERIILEES